MAMLVYRSVVPCDPLCSTLEVNKHETKHERRQTRWLVACPSFRSRNHLREFLKIHNIHNLAHLFSKCSADHSSDIHDPLIPPPATTSTTPTTTTSSNSNNNNNNNNNNSSSNNNNNNNNRPLQPGTSNQQPQPATPRNQQPPRATTYVFVSTRTSNTQWHHGNSTFWNPKFVSLKVLRKR